MLASEGGNLDEDPFSSENSRPPPTKGLFGSRNSAGKDDVMTGGTGEEEDDENFFEILYG